MIFQELEYKQLNSYNKIFIDFVSNNSEFVENRFPNNDKFEFEKIKFDENKRNNLINAIRNTSQVIELSQIQIINLEQLKYENSFTITTGQQIGFLGGSLYTLYKIITNIKLSIDYKSKFPDKNFIPIFWLEDNDHDQIEATESYYYSKDKNIKRIQSLEKIDISDHLVTSFLENNDCTLEVINDFFEDIQFSDFKDNLKNQVLEFYKSKYQKDSFLKLLNSIFSDFGVLFLSANELRNTGAFKDLVLKEVEFFIESNACINTANEYLKKNHYSLQADSDGIKLFYHQDNTRSKIIYQDGKFKLGEEYFNLNELKIFIEDQPERFSPNVFLRCIFQDSLLPNLTYIAGPGEISYWAQTKELFEYFELNMSQIHTRHSITLINSKIEKLISKVNKNLEYFYKKFVLIESELKENHHLSNLDELFINSKSNLQELFDNIKLQGIKIDKTLEQTVLGSYQKSLNLVEILEKKFESANHKLHNDENQKYKEISNFIFPNNKLQERVFNIVSILSLLGYENIKNLINEILNYDSFKHQIIKID